jgi:hypothetical protein
MLNKRKAMIGWLVYSAAKPLVTMAVKERAKDAKKKAKDARSTNGGGKKRRVAMVVAAAGAAVGALAFWRSRKGAATPGPEWGPSGPAVSATGESPSESDEPAANPDESAES